MDLHGGDPDDVLAKAEYTEIKERVMFEVRGTVFIVTCRSANEFIA